MKFKNLSQNEKKALKKEFLESEKAALYRKAERILVISVVGVIFSIATTMFDVYYQTGTINYVLDAFLFIFTAAFAYKTMQIKTREIDLYLKDKNSLPKKKKSSIQ